MERIAVVTGGSRGIGFAIVKKFLTGGFHVISVSRNIGELKALHSDPVKNLHILQADLSKKDEVARIVKEIKQKFDTIDVLVNNAGVYIPGESHLEEDETFELQMSLNLNAAYYLSKALIPMMKKSGDAYLFNICSTASITAYADGGSYCISKHALLGFSKVMRQELMPYGISVSSIIPGATFTESWNGTELPQSRFMQTHTIADAIWFAWEGRESAVMEEIILRPKWGDI